MALTLGYKSLKVEDNTVEVQVPENDTAKLMYYLSCVSTVIMYDKANKLTDYRNYNSLTLEEQADVYACAILLNPKMFLDAGIFIINPKLLTRGLSNQFYKITDSRVGVHVNQEIAIGGVSVKVLQIMVCEESWINRNYIRPLENLNARRDSNRYQINSSRNDSNVYVNYNNRQESRCTGKKCCIWMTIIIVVSLIIYSQYH